MLNPIYTLCLGVASNLTKFFPSGFPTDGLAPAVWQGGETEALARLDKHLERKVTPVI